MPEVAASLGLAALFLSSARVAAPLSAGQRRAARIQERSQSLPSLLVLLLRHSLTIVLLLPTTTQPSTSRILVAVAAVAVAALKIAAVEAPAVVMAAV